MITKKIYKRLLVYDSDHWWINKSRYAHRDPKIGPASYVDGNYYYVIDRHHVSAESLKNEDYIYEDERN